jgi:hypothetical protein
MSDAHGSLFKARYEMIAREYGSHIANLDFHVIDIGDPIFGPMVIPRMGRAKRANDDMLLNRPIGGISLPSLPSESEGEDWRAEEDHRRRQEDNRRATSREDWRDRQDREWNEVWSRGKSREIAQSLAWLDPKIRSTDSLEVRLAKILASCKQVNNKR